MSERTNFICRLPEDLFTLILLKLPIKPLLTCTSVCKTWNSFIKKPEFFSSHLDRTIASHEEDDSHLCLLQRCTLPVETGRDSFFLLPKDRDFSVLDALHLPYRGKYGFQVVASCNGLICLMKGKNPWIFNRISLNLWNPFIRKSVILDGYRNLDGKSVILDEYRNLSAVEAVGLGFDSRSSDFKLVKIVEELGNELTLKVEVYSVKTSSWKRLPDVEAKYDDKWMNLYRPMTYLNGALYFIASRRNPRRCLILGVDLSEEVFHEIMLPDCMTETLIEFWFRASARFYLFTVGESLAVLWIRDTWMEIWVMKEIGVKETWTQLSTIRVEAMPSSFTGLVLTKDARVLLSFGSYYSYEIGRLFLHDVKSQETLEIANDRKDTFIFLGDYVESLALMDKGNDFSTHFEVESGDAAAAAAADDDDTSRTSSLRNAHLLLNEGIADLENNVPLNEGIADLEGDGDLNAGNSSDYPCRDFATSSNSHATNELSGNESDTSNGLSMLGL